MNCKSRLIEEVVLSFFTVDKIKKLPYGWQIKMVLK